ncbi:hypothetical protein NDU88_002857 [Pleurodeles waltl]|uniref:Uncharacterized protein n=1 Tax=Pleurodeles waltl TaxID=8319 RepID=A0AAV7W4C4_PLEWA|nr:hypothetical protein NDU88_002857 [Pleurodeles waltl]
MGVVTGRPPWRRPPPVSQGHVSFDLLHLEALPATSNLERLPGNTGLQKALMRAPWGHRGEDPEECRGSGQEEEDRGNQREGSDDQSDYGDQHSRHLTWPAGHSNCSVFPRTGPEDQEAEKPTILPLSGESVALAGTVPQWMALTSTQY